jgi:acetyltransferase
MAADLPELVEVDINPLWTDAQGVLALDARARLIPVGGERAAFAIEPYPRDLESEIADASGAIYGLRPVRPEDAPLLGELIAACDPEDLRFRFMHALAAAPDRLAVRLAQIDYRREMAFLASKDEAAAGVARLAADPDNERAEFDILVRSDLKGRGLGTALMRRLIAHARGRGVKVVFGQVASDNARMLALCDDLGFLRRGRAADPLVVDVELELAN